MAKNVKDAEEKLGKEKVEEIVDKDWKVTELPSKEEIAKEKHKSPKARNNINSRKNLIQYRKKTKEQKEAMVKNLRFVEVEEDVNPSDILNSSPILDTIEKMMPARDVLANRKEQEIYYNYIKLILEDFDSDDLTASDLDDIITLALNRVIEYRLLSVSSTNPKLVLDIGPTVEKFRKFSEKIKSGLASRRVDRIDVKHKPAFSIVNLAAHLDEQEKLDFEERMQRLEQSRTEYKPPQRDAEGLLVNKEDAK